MCLFIGGPIPGSAFGIHSWGVGDRTPVCCVQDKLQPSPPRSRFGPSGFVLLNSLPKLPPAPPHPRICHRSYTSYTMRNLHLA